MEHSDIWKHNTVFSRTVVTEIKHSLVMIQNQHYLERDIVDK